MSYGVTEFCVFLPPIDMMCVCFFSRWLSKWWHAAGSSLVPSWLATVEQSPRKDGEGRGFGCRETVQLYCTMQQSDSSLLLCQINIEVSGAPRCSSISARCLEGGKGRITWELPLSSFILAKLALDSQDIKDYCDSVVAHSVTGQFCFL